MKINLSNFDLSKKQNEALLQLIKENKNFLKSLESGVETCLTFELGIKENIVGAYYFEILKSEKELILTKFKIQ